MPTIRFARAVHESPFHGGLRQAFMRVFITGIAVFLAIAIVPGLETSSFGAGLAAVLVLTFLNLILRPILFLLTLPLIVFTLGLFLVVLNALLLDLTAYLVKGFTVSGFWPSVGGALVISLVTTVLNSWTVDRRLPADPYEEPRRPPKIINPD
ncbi:MAG: phage holin family protein [Nitrospira sp.]|nr:phage holin family protein [Nitrospira sp.]MBS0166525.1 phage holin family protein [Nitrospira sp.]